MNHEKDAAPLPLFGIIGRSNVGKTSLIEQLIPELSGLGLRVAVAKQTHHDGFDLDHPGKDSWRFSRAGATAVLLNAPTSAALLESVQGYRTLEQLAQLIKGRADLVLAEGFRDAAIPAIEVYRSGISDGLLADSETLLAVVSDADIRTTAPRLKPTQIRELAKLILRSIRRQTGTDTSSVDGRQAQPFAAPPRSPSLLEKSLAEAVAFHGHACAGQVLGVRMALRGCDELGISVPDRQKRLLVFVEIDRCAADAISTVTGCKLGKRTLKFVDYGKLAATFLDTRTGRAVRIAAREDARGKADSYVPAADDAHATQLQAYQIMPDEELFTVQHVRVHVAPEELPGRPSQRVVCAVCAEGINDGRQVDRDGTPLCKSCAAGTAYYSPVTLVF